MRFGMNILNDLVFQKYVDNKKMNNDIFGFMIYCIPCNPYYSNVHPKTFIL